MTDGHLSFGPDEFWAHGEPYDPEAGPSDPVLQVEPYIGKLASGMAAWMIGVASQHGGVHGLPGLYDVAFYLGEPRSAVKLAIQRMRRLRWLTMVEYSRGKPSHFRFDLPRIHADLAHRA